MTTVLIIVAIVLVGSAIWGWRGTVSEPTIRGVIGVPSEATSQQIPSVACR